MIVLFGATGDLAKRKLLPGLFHLFEAGLLPARWRILGASRGELSDDGFRDLARTAIDSSGRKPSTAAAWATFASRLSSVGSGDARLLAAAVEGAERELGPGAHRLHYLSVPPAAFGEIVGALGAAGLAERARVILEKPFGYDLGSAVELNATLHQFFDESQIFRIDHFIGKEAVQNILAVRFANGLFEPIWNRDHIEHVQIDVPEQLSIGTRAAFYEQTGAFRDMVVTHLFQVLGFVAMEPPTSLEARVLRAEKDKVFDAMPPLRPGDMVRGQYRGYHGEPGVAADSDTETFVAVRAFVDNWRWSGVPFYLRTGKRMAQSRHALTIAFRQPPRRMFPLDCHFTAESFGSDHMTFELGDPGTIEASFLAKVPGPRMQLGEARMEFSYAAAFGGTDALEAYERLIHDVMMGDQALFTTAAGIERLWQVSAPVLDAPSPVLPYEPGSWGPEAAIADLIAPRRWHLPSDHV